MRWGSARTKPDEAAMKEIQKRLDRLHEAKVTETNKAEYLELSKRMDELLQKKKFIGLNGLEFHG